GQVNRLPFFTNHFFDTYLLISEDTPVGELARGRGPLRGLSPSGLSDRLFPFFQTKSEFTVEFSVSDHQGVITRKVNIQVGDVNDNAPTFHNQPYSVRIPENTPVGTPIFIVNATDPDLGAGGSVLYSFQPPSQFFAIDSARGIVTVTRELDYEVTQAYQLTVNATDQDKTRPLSTLANLAIIITDVQDMDPIFINLPYSTNIYEHSPPGTTVRVITAIDQDKGRPRGIGYTIVSGNTNSIFALDYISGALTLNGLLDRENPLYSHGFLLTVKGTELNDDRTPSDATVTTTFNILVIDINDNAPEFNSSEYSVAITELAQVGFALPLFIQVVDKDEGLNSMFEVYLVGNNSHHFIISPTSVQGKADIRIRVAIPLDYETVDRYDFDLFANESVPDHVGYAKVKITLINENDNRPIFSQPLYNVSLYENVTVGTSVLTVLATDNDVGTFGEVSYFFSDDPDRFSLDKDTGLVMLIARLDYELIQRFTLTVIARDGGGEETTGRVRINVLDVNDNVPTFQKDAYVGALRENEPSVTQLVRLRATDEDSPPNNQVTYSIVNASAFRSYFDISVYEGYGVISVSRPLDYEQIPNGLIYLTVMAKDAGSPPLNSTVPVTIEVFDENDNPPTFSRPAYFVSVVENIMAGATVLFLNATDLDRSREYGQESIIYSLEGSSQFRINARSGEITTTSLLDRETKSEYILIVRAVDGGVGHNQKTGIATVNVTLLDINDNHPSWKDAPYYINLVEMTPPDSDVTTVVAVDPDLGENGTLVYSIQPPNKFYSLNSTTGKIRTTHVMLDRENPDPLEAELMRRIVVSVADCGRPPLRATSSATVFVNLLDLNDNDPTFQNLPFVAEVLEGTPTGVSVYQVVAIDLDEGLNGLVSYRMQVGMPRMDFLINSSSGVVITTAELDRERIAEYQLRVVASDAGTPTKSSTSTLTVRVLDVNDETPTFSPAVYNVSVSEDVPREFRVVWLNCTDNDVGLNAELSYFITEGNVDGKFSVGYRDAFVRTVVGLDRETTAAYTLVLEAIDNGPVGKRRTGTATVFVTVLDVNDNRPIFLQSSYEASVPEDIPEGHSIVQLKATDADEGEFGRVWYRILHGNHGNNFQIDVSHGLLRRGPRPLDRERNSSHVLVVEAYNQDLGPMRSSVRVIVYVEDVNDEAPVFTQQQYSRLGLRETAGIGTSVIVVRATDRDTGDGGLVNYRILSGAEGKFEIDESTGLITTVDHLDYETKTSYLMNVSATDRAPPFHRGFCSVHVTLLNELDEAVQFSNASYEAAILENLALGTEILRVQAYSIDNLNQITYRFDAHTSARAKALFKIDAITGAITVQGLVDREKGDFYTLTVVADDGGPKVDSTVVSGSRATAHSTALPNPGHVPSKGARWWVITSNDSVGEVFVARPLDREELDLYILKVMASDRGTPPRRKDHILQVTILDVNDNPPVIESAFGYNVSVNEKVIPFSILSQPLLHQRESPSLMPLFRENSPGPGHLTGSSPQATTHVYVTIVDENDNAPVFPQPHYEVLLDEGPDTVNTSLVTVRALDLDEGPNGTVTYAIVAGNILNTFRIDRHTGVISAIKELDYEISHGRYTLIVTATDQCPILSHRLTSTTTVLVNVNDINDNVPTFPRDYEGPFDVTEGQPGPRVWTFLAHDRDSGPNGQVEYSLVDGDPLGEFVISPVEGVLRVRKDVELDRETIAFYNLTICARDRGVPPLSSTMLVGIRVLDINDNDPVLLNLPMNITISENSPVSSFVTRVLASDADSGCNALLTFNITAGNRERAFLINATTGIVTVNRPLDRERIPEYKLTISVKDNPENPRIARKVRRRAPWGQVLDSNPRTPLTVLNGPILALDADQDVYAVVIYQLLGPQSGLFDIDNNTGVVTVRSGVLIDREAFSPPVLELVLLAEDIGLLNGTANLLVAILDDNDNWPTFSPATLTAHLLENCPPGFSVLQVTATDEDSGLNGELVYRIEAGAQDRFLIHPVTGVIRVGNATIDREEQEAYRLMVVATDRGTVPLSGTAIITILIDDINDSRPEFLNPIQTVSVLESAEPGSVIANVTAIDLDLNPKLEYHIIDIVAKDDTDRLVPNQEDAFAVNINTGSGRPSPAMVPLPSPPARTPAKLTVNILDVNDNTPQFKPFGITYYTERILEGATPGTTLIAVAAVDPDKGLNGLVTYALLDLTPPGYVQLEDASAGKVIAKRTVDYEEVHWLNFTVRASDNGSPPRAAEIPVYLEIVDVNDNNPIFDQPSYQEAVLEDVPVLGQSVRWMKGLKPPSPYNPGDVASNRRENSVQVRGPTEARFARGWDGGGSKKSPLYTELPLQPFSIFLRQCLTKLLRLAPPSSRAPQEIPLHSNVYEVYATDKDEGLNGAVRYSFLKTAGNRDWEFFSIDPVSGLIQTAQRLDREKQAVYSLILVASDLGQPVPYETMQPLQVALEDIDDNEPLFVRPPKGRPQYQLLTVPEHSPRGTLVGNVTGAVDADEGPNAVVYYFIAAGNEEKNFRLQPDGRLLVLRDLDREREAVFSFIVKASSNRSWTPPRGASPALDLVADLSLQEVRVVLEDIDDQPPRFTKAEYTAGVATDAKVGSELIQVLALDADIGNNSLVFYGILAIHYFRALANDSEDVGQVFTMGSVDGILRTFDLFMAYSPGYFVVDIVARDLAGHNDTAIIGIYILRDDQRVKIVINEIPDRVRGFEEEFIRLLANITGAIVNTDDVQFHVDKKGRVNFAQTELLIHVVNRDTNRILDVDRVIQMIDENKEQLRNLFRNYNVLDVQPAISVRLPDDMSALQMAIIVLAILLFLAAMLFILMNWYYRTVHKRKLKAIVAGSAGNRGFIDIMDMPNTNKYSFDGANPVWLDPFCRNLELAAQAEHEDDLPENLSEIADLWNSPTRTHGTFGREPAAVKPDDDRYLRAAIQEYDNIAKLGQIIREGPIKLIQTELEEEPGDRSPGQGSLRFRHKPPVELKGPDGIHVVHGSTGTLLATDLNSLPEDDQKGLGRSLETLTAAEATAFERNARTESAKSTPLHKLRDVIMESPLEITEL
uniref:Cadherin-23 n=1 Tax=Ictidomys tridecemlineatus TaxID=43179 RepID=I3M2D2_ICTTR